MAIKRKNKSEKQPESIVIPIVFNQNEKSWEQQPFRNCFPDAPVSLLQFVPEFTYFVFNLADLPNEQIRLLQEYSALRGVLLAMKHYKNLDFLNHHFEEIVRFIEKHPEKADLWQTVFAEETEKAKVIIEEWKLKLLETQNELMQTKTMVENAKIAAENAKIVAEKSKENARIEAENARVFLTLLHGWYKKAAIQFIADIAGISLKESLLWISSFDYIKANRTLQLN